MHLGARVRACVCARSSADSVDPGACNGARCAALRGGNAGNSARDGVMRSIIIWSSAHRGASSEESSLICARLARASQAPRRQVERESTSRRIATARSLCPLVRSSIFRNRKDQERKGDRIIGPTRARKDARRKRRFHDVRYPLSYLWSIIFGLSNKHSSR